ncbi:thiamin pyrophosphokinase [Bifidobacterium ruminantium]|uniref:Thiamine diphosphokinase n=2 Tax=Bifidobacterium ruminantium TaxID=78346 RepID=A0A087D4Q0_BIFRU|nr:thiamin pyrophosphokinase [Bifidobacterium ruminantium]
MDAHVHYLRMTMNSNTCVIFGAGDYYDEISAVPSEAFVIAADGGYDHAQTSGIDVDFLVGDFDSITGTRPTNDDHTIALPTEKDDPDLLSAMKIGWRHGARTFHIYGALGGRIDHTIANIQLVALLAAHGAIGYLHGDGAIVTAVCDGALDFPTNDVAPGRMVSVFSHSDISTGVSETGLKYELDHASMSSVRVNGLSNEFLKGKPSRIEVEHGTLVVTFPIEAPLPRVLWSHGFTGDLGALDTSVSSALAQPGDRRSGTPAKM